MTFPTLIAALVSMQLLATCPSDAARILLIIDSMSSHVMQFSRIGLDLARLGHDVRVLAPSSARVPDFMRTYRQDRIGNGENEPPKEHVAGVNKGKLDNQANTTISGEFNFTTFQVKETISYADTPAYKDIIIKAGRNYQPDSIERAAAEVEGVRAGCVAAFGVFNEDGGTEDLVVVFETRREAAEEVSRMVRQVSAVIKREVGLAPNRIVAVKAQCLPKTTSGKLRRNEVRNLLLAGELPVLAPTT